MPSLTIKNVTKKFGEVVAVDDVSFHVEDESFLTLLGPSGCGKTTMLRLIAGFEKADAGEIYIGDKLVDSPEKGVHVPALERNLGMVFQSYALWPHMTVNANISYPLKLRNIPKAQIKSYVAKSLSLVQLKGVENRYPSELSGGQQQRIALARSLVYEPSILLLDEPLSNLDAKLRKEMRIELRELQRDTKITAVYVTHDQAEALVISDKICVMNHGVIQQVGSPNNIYNRSANIFVADFMGGSNFLKGRLADRDLKQGKYLSVELFNGDKVLSLCENVPEAEEVYLFIRPEFISLTAAEPTGKDQLANSIKVKVNQKAYLGSQEEFSLEVNGERLQAITRPKENIRRGSEAWVTFHADDSLILTG